MSNSTSACKPFHVVNKQLSLFNIAQFFDDVGPTSTKSWNFLLGGPFSERPPVQTFKVLTAKHFIAFSSEKLFSSWQKKKKHIQETRYTFIEKFYYTSSLQLSRRILFRNGGERSSTRATARKCTCQKHESFCCNIASWIKCRTSFWKNACIWAFFFFFRFSLLWSIHADDFGVSLGQRF